MSDELIDMQQKILSWLVRSGGVLERVTIECLAFHDEEISFHNGMSELILSKKIKVSRDQITDEFLYSAVK